MSDASTVRSTRGPMLLVVLYAIPLLLSWSALSGRAAAGGVATALGLAAGILGLNGFALNIILGARLPGLHRYLGGLDALYAIHRINGRVAYLLLFTHVASLVVARSGDAIEEGLGLLTPAAGTVVFLGVLAFVAMTVAMAMTLYVRLTHEMFVYVQRAFGIVFLVGATHAFMTTGVKALAPSLAFYLSALALVAVGAYLYRSVLGDLLVRRFDYVVTDARELDSAVMEIRMEPVGRRINPKPGQFVFVTFYSDRFNARFHPVSVESRGPSAVIALRPGQMRGQFHPFSLTSAPEDPHLSLVVKAVGSFTRALHALEPGAAARVEGPYGEFSYRNVSNRRQVWIAGGIGITPFLSMARSLRSDEELEIELYWGVNTRRQAYFEEELRRKAAEVPGFVLTVVAEDADGFISAEMVARRHDLQEIDVFIVGPAPMEEALRSQFAEAGVPPGRIHSERFAFGPRR